jgi:hypothetical protein
LHSHAAIKPKTIKEWADKSTAVAKDDKMISSLMKKAQENALSG